MIHYWGPELTHKNEVLQWTGCALGKGKDMVVLYVYSIFPWIEVKTFFTKIQKFWLLHRTKHFKSWIRFWGKPKTLKIFSEKWPEYSWYLFYNSGSLGGSVGKNLPAMKERSMLETRVWFLDQEGSPEKGNATQSSMATHSCWEIPNDQGAW